MTILGTHVTYAEGHAMRLRARARWACSDEWPPYRAVMIYLSLFKANPARLPWRVNPPSP